MPNLKPLTVFDFFLALPCERIFIETQSIESRCYRTGKYTVCMRIPASFNPEFLQTGAVKGLITNYNYDHHYHNFIYFTIAVFLFSISSVDWNGIDFIIMMIQHYYH